MSSSRMISSVVGLVFLVGALATPVTVIALKKSNNLRSCDLEKGTVCIPTACFNNSCSLFKDAVCVPDRCGCEARFFNWITKESTYSDVSRMCSSANFVLNFLNFTISHSNDSTIIQSDDDHLVVLQFFKEFNLLVTEILKDITDYMKAVTNSTPTQANIDKLKKIIATLKLRSKVVKLTAGDKVTRADSTIVSDEHDDFKDIEEKSLWGKVIKTAFNIGKDLLSDEDETITADVEVKSFLGDLAKGAFKLAKEVLFDEDGVTPSKIGKKFAVDVKTLDDILNGNASTYASAIKSGKVAISDKQAQMKLAIPLQAASLI